MTQAHRINSVNVNEVFHGLSDIYVVPRRLALAASATRPLTTIKVASSPLGLSSLQAAFLSGGTAVPAAATLLFEIAGTVTVGATVALTFHGITVDGNIEDITIEYDIQTGDTLTLCTTGIKTNVNKAVDGVVAFTNGRATSTNPNNTRAQISVGLLLKYATPTGAITNTTAVGTITALASTGLSGNDFDVTFEIKPKPPTIVTLESGYPRQAGLEHAGLTQGLTINAAGTTNPIESDQDYFPASTYITASSASLTLNMLQDSAVRTLRVAGGITGLASTSSYHVAILSLLRNQQTYGLIATTMSQTVDGELDVALFRQVRGSSVTLGRTKTHAPIAVTLDLDSIGTQDIAHLLLAKASLA